MSPMRECLHRAGKAIKCYGGPWDGEYVCSLLGSSWPWVLKTGELGWYELTRTNPEDDGAYTWTGETTSREDAE